MQKILFGEGQVHGPIPALLGHGSKIASLACIPILSSPGGETAKK
jgi:hypothetical protein